MSKFTIGIQTTFVLILLSLYGQAAAQTSTDRSTHSLQTFSYSESTTDTNLEADEEEGMPERGQFLFRYRYTGEEVEPNITISHNGEFLASLNHLSPTAFDTLINVQIEKGDSLIYDFSFGISEEQIILHEELNSYSHGFWARGYSVQFISEDAEGNVKHYGTMNFEYYLIPPFEGFVLLANPASIEQGEASSLNFHAVELPDEPVIIPENTAVDMLLDENGSHLGGLLLPEFDPDNKYDAVFNFPYSVLTNTPIFYEADINPMKAGGHVNIDTVSETVSIGVRSSHNWNILGITTLEVREEGEEDDLSIHLNITGDDRIWPTISPHGVQATFRNNLGHLVKNTTDFIVSTASDGEPKANQLVEISAEWIPESGGHNHNGKNALKAPPEALMGRFTNLSNHETANGKISATTDSEGIIHLQYEAPEFGGEIDLKAQLTTEDGIIEASESLTIRVPGLVLLTDASQLYEKVGGVPNHHGPRLDGGFPGSRTPDNNHWVNETVGQLLIALAVIYNEAFPDRHKIRYNDISLPNGGRFDINGKWAGSRYHTLHRLGFNVDVRTSLPRDDGIPLTLEDEIQRLVKELDPNAIVDVHGSRYRHPDTGNWSDSRHFHIDFRIFQVLQP